MDKLLHGAGIKAGDLLSELQIEAADIQIE
jgi:hypothetical protein